MGAQDRDDGIVGQSQVPQACRPRSWKHEPDIDNTVEEHRDDVIGVGVAHLDVSVLMVRRGEGDAHRSMRERRMHRETRMGSGRSWKRTASAASRQQSACSLGVGHETLATSGERHTPSAADEQGRTDGPLEPCHAIADRGLGHHQRSGCPAEAALLHPRPGTRPCLLFR